MTPQFSAFEDWVRYIFDRSYKPEMGRKWYFDLSVEHWNPFDNPSQALAYLTRLFEEADNLLAPYDDDQVGEGLWYLASNGCSDAMFAVFESCGHPRDFIELPPWEGRKRCIEAMTSLYEKLYLPRCGAVLGHLQRDPADPAYTALNGACYMWWDLIPTLGQPDQRYCMEQDQAVLRVMEETLALPSVACQESALHGLGHWHTAYPERVEKIIEHCLKRSPDLPDDLKAYALSAKAGCVL
jgi:hypothetical protein